MAGQGSGGNVLAALCSFFIPGLGQLIQGRLGKAIWHFVLTAALWLVSDLADYVTGIPAGDRALLARAITLHQTVELVRITIDTVRFCARRGSSLR